MRRWLGIALATSVLSTVGAESGVAAECDAPKPDFHVSRPGPSIDPTAAEFNGVWTGTWTIHARSDTLFLCTKMYVSVKDNGNAAVMFCRGSLREAGRLPECLPQDAKIEGGVLTFGHDTFKANGPNKLSAQGAQQGSGTILMTEYERER